MPIVPPVIVAGGTLDRGAVAVFQQRAQPIQVLAPYHVKRGDGKVRSICAQMQFARLPAYFAYDGLFTVAELEIIFRVNTD